MAKAKKTARYHELTKPTSTSRALTWLLLLALPILGFLLGMKYQESMNSVLLAEVENAFQMQQQLDASPSAE